MQSVQETIKSEEIEDSIKCHKRSNSSPTLSRSKVAKMDCSSDEEDGDELSTKAEEHEMKNLEERRQAECEERLQEPREEVDDKTTVNNNNTIVNGSSLKPVLSIPSTAISRHGSHYKFPDKKDLQDLLTQNLAHHVAARNEKLRQEYLLSQRLNFCRQNFSSMGPEATMQALITKAHQEHPSNYNGDSFPHINVANRCSSVSSPSDSEAEEQKLLEDNKDLPLRVKESSNLLQQSQESQKNFSMRTTSFSVHDILDPHKFTGRTSEDDHIDSSSEKQDDDENAYISGN